MPVVSKSKKMGRWGPATGLARNSLTGSLSWTDLGNAVVADPAWDGLLAALPLLLPSGSNPLETPMPPLYCCCIPAPALATVAADVSAEAGVVLPYCWTLLPVLSSADEPDGKLEGEVWAASGADCWLVGG